MESILKWLFSSDLCIGREEKEERNLAKEGAAVMEAAEKLSACLPPELHQAWRDYADRVERFQDLERQNEFERGFVVAVFLNPYGAWCSMWSKVKYPEACIRSHAGFGVIFVCSCVALREIGCYILRTFEKIAVRIMPR